MTTSSPGCQRVTPAPTFQTTPEPSDPPMWWSSSGWESNTDTGTPRAAQTLLKFTPAAMTRTMTSKAPGSGTSISSSWKASTGSPSRSSRITQAAMVAGSSPGSVLTSVTSVRSAWAMRSSSSSAVGRGRRGWYRRAGGGRLRAQQLVLARRPLAADEERGRLEHLRARKRTLRARADRVAALLDVGLDRCRVLRVDRPDPLARLLALEDHGVRGGVLVRDDEDDRARSDAARRDVDLPRGDHAGDLDRRGRAHRPAAVVGLAAAAER